MLVQLNRIVANQRRRLLVAGAAFVLAASILAAHSATSGEDQDAMGMAVACLAVVETAALALGAVLVLRPSWGWRLLLPARSSAPAGPSRRPIPRARAGPPATQVFRL